MDSVRLIDLHPRLFHMAEDGAWPQIAHYGLLSATAILDRVEVKGSQRTALESNRRMESVVVETADCDLFVIRDQKPLNPDKLARCLVDMTVPEWLRLLNRKVFFWPTRKRCEDLLGARAYRDQAHTIIEVDTARLLERHGERVTLARINTGAVLYDPPKRGSFTFMPFGEVPFDEWRQKRGRRRAIAEVAVDYSVPDVAELTVAVWRADQDGWQPISS